MADPGFPVGGGVDLVRGAVDPRGGYVLKILHVKTKESGPVGGGRAPGAPPPLDPPMKYTQDPEGLTCGQSVHVKSQNFQKHNISCKSIWVIQAHSKS